MQVYQVTSNHLVSVINFIKKIVITLVDIITFKWDYSKMYQTKQSTVI